MAKCNGCGEEVIFKEGRCPICGQLQNKVKVQTSQKVNNPGIKRKEVTPKVVNTRRDNSLVAERCALSVCLIEGSRGLDSWHGTGWYLGNNIICTNAHVVTGKNKDMNNLPSVLYANFYNSNVKIPLVPCFISVDEDIALLRPKEGIIPNLVPPLKIRNSPTRLGEPIFTIGNPLHYKFTYKEGAVGCPEYDAPPKKFPVIQTTIDLNGGNSGGPVFDLDGQVVGMVSFAELTRNGEKLEAVIGYGFAVSARAIVLALNSAR